MVKTRSQTPDFSSCPCSGKNLPKLVHPSILAILNIHPAHGYAIIEQIAQQHTFPNEPPKHPGIYRILRQMEADALVTSKTDNAGSGPARRVYSITAKGKACLQEWIDSLHHLETALHAFFKLTQQ